MSINISGNSSSNIKSGKIFNTIKIISILLAISIILIIQLIRRYNANYFPIGWDTWSYISNLKLLIDGNWRLFFIKNNNYSFLYSIIELFLIKIFPINALNLEFIFPLMLSCLVPFILGYFSKNIFEDEKEYYFTIFISTVWLNLYRFAADLHRTLFAFILLFSFLYLYFILSFNNLKNIEFLKFILISVMLSLTQLEISIYGLGIILTMEFLFIVRSVFDDYSKIILLIPNIIYKIFIVIISILPSFIIALNTNSYFLGLSIPSSALNKIEFNYIIKWGIGNVFTIFTLISFLIIIKQYLNNINIKKNSLLISIILLPLIITLFSYFIPIPFLKFAPRALMYIPSPIFISHAMIYLLFYINNDIILKYKTKKITVCAKSKNVVLALIIMLSFIMGFNSAYKESNVHMRNFVDTEFLHNIKDVKNDITEVIEDKSMLIIYDLNNIAVYHLYDNVVTYYLGEHNSYVGSLDNLLLLKPTTYTNFFTDYYSNVIFNVLIENVSTIDQLLEKYSIVLIENLCDVVKYQISMYEMIEVNEDLFIINDTISQVIINIKDIVYEKGNWWGDETSLIKTYYKAGDMMIPIYVDFIVPYFNSDDALLSLTYHDTYSYSTPFEIIVYDDEKQYLKEKVIFNGNVGIITEYKKPINLENYTDISLKLRLYLEPLGESPTHLSIISIYIILEQ